MNTAKKRQYFSLCPSMDEVKYIYMMYENYRLKMDRHIFKAVFGSFS